jgi:hypothetical protein
MADAAPAVRHFWLGHGHIGWAPRDINWRTAVLFMVGSACFSLGALPGYASAVPTAVVGLTFFVGSIFFTSAGFSQLTQTIRAGKAAGHLSSWQIDSVDWWGCIVQSAGTLWFNLNTFFAMKTGFTVHQQNLRIWTPDFIGSICFLVASELAIWSVCRRALCICRDEGNWWIAVINMVGSVFFMVSALAAFVVPDTGTLLDAALANSGTLLGGLCFFWAARLLITDDST